MLKLAYSPICITTIEQLTIVYLYITLHLQIFKETVIYILQLSKNAEEVCNMQGIYLNVEQFHMLIIDTKLQTLFIECIKCITSKCRLLFYSIWRVTG